jgi:hypothetical protein
MSDQPQYERLRKIGGCPICKLPKDRGLVICWTCNRGLKGRHNGTWGKAAEVLIDRCEFVLECAAAQSEHGYGTHE